jgi:hypothetical protein
MKSVNNAADLFLSKTLILLHVFHLTTTQLFTTDLIFSEERQIFSEVFYLVTFIETCRKSSEQFWSVTVSATEARHNHGALQSCNRPVTAHCDPAPVQSVVRANRRTWIRGCQYSVQITNLKFCVSVP